MRHLFTVVVAVALTTTSCYAQEQSGLFRDVFPCPDRGPSSLCVFGTVSREKPITLLGKNWKSSASPKEEFRYIDSEKNATTMTRLEVTTKDPPTQAPIVAVLVESATIKTAPLTEIKDEKLLEKISPFLAGPVELALDPDLHYSTNTRFIKLSPSIELFETKLTKPSAKNGTPVGCGNCQDIVPMLGMWVENGLVDLFEDFHYIVPYVCGGLVSAFTMSNRLHVFSTASNCDSETVLKTLIHDLSGKKPELAFSSVHIEAPEEPSESKNDRY
jgi:hypothetical protein